MNKSRREVIMEEIIRETLWMARRYAHKRRTFAPTTINECIDSALELGIEIKPDTVDGIDMYAEDGDLGTWNNGKFIKE